MKSVYSAVRTGSLNKAVCASSLEGLNIVKRGFESQVSIFQCGIKIGRQFGGLGNLDFMLHAILSYQNTDP